ncbi:MAG TPA: L,D-transpeptidase, partial [Hyphomicrobiaceae bacterium]|nr:L,D-transpeptidase [Hyphomicrobiaceae bacterium]
MRSSIAVLAVLACGLVFSADPALAQSSWSGGTPVYDSDVRKKADDAEAAREERRKARPPVIY